MRRAERTLENMVEIFGLEMKIIPESDFGKYPVPRRY